MSSTLPYLQKLRKSDLSEFAETTKLPDYLGLKKSELEAALDEHLRSNSSTYSKDPSLGEYYKRLSSTSKSPVKKIVEKVTEMVKTDDEAPAPAKKQRRKTTSPPDTTDTEGAVTALIKTPGKELARRSSILTSQIPLPPSPAVVTDAIDQQTRRIRSSISHAYQRTQIHEYADATRDLLSSPLTVNIIAIIVEALGLRGDILPNKRFVDIPPIPYVRSTKTPVYVPDLFLLLNDSFWAPFSLWALSTIIIPAFIAYFINLPLKAHPSHSYATRRAATQSGAQSQFDPFIFNVAKGLLAYLIFAGHFTFGGLYQNYTISQVNKNVLGGYAGLLTSSGIGAAVALYEAILKK